MSLGLCVQFSVNPAERVFSPLMTRLALGLGPQGLPVSAIGKHAKHARVLQQLLTS